MKKQNTSRMEYDRGFRAAVDFAKACYDCGMTAEQIVALLQIQIANRKSKAPKVIQ